MDPLPGTYLICDTGQSSILGGHTFCGSCAFTKFSIDLKEVEGDERRARVPICPMCKGEVKELVMANHERVIFVVVDNESITIDDIGVGGDAEPVIVADDDDEHVVIVLDE
jgi:hypothetical protein